MISSKVSSSSHSRSKMLVAGTIRYRLLLTATTHRRITPFSRVALSYSYSTSSYSCTGGGDDGVGEEEEEKDCEDDDDNYDEDEEDDGIDEVNLPTVKRHAKWTDDLVR